MTEAAFDVLSRSPLPRVLQEMPHQQREKERTAEAAPLLLQHNTLNKQQQQEDRVNTVLDALLMRIRIFARTTPTVRPPSQKANPHQILLHAPSSHRSFSLLSA